jgi:prolyl-tRNA editing enzyme YbaK/EbsC (Cys-tRNA(Pro) deacylase)
LLLPYIGLRLAFLDGKPKLTAETARAWLAERAPDLQIIDTGRSVATVSEAAQALGVDAARIAKTLALRINHEVILLVARGDARLDNGRCKAAFGARPRMLQAVETEVLTGHPVGGVCPFGLKTSLPIFCDVSIRPFATVYPAAGSRTSSVEIGPERLCSIIKAQWTDVCRLAEAPS